MEVFEAIKNRRSIRKFEDRAILPEQMERLKQSALASPSARDLQPWKFVFVSNREILDEITRLTVEKMLSSGDEKVKETLESRNYSIFYGAPTVVFIFGDKDNTWSDIDCGIAVENLALEALSDGLGSCIIGLVGQAFEEHPELYDKLGVPSSHKFKISIAIGYPAMNKQSHILRSDRISCLD